RRKNYRDIDCICAGGVFGPNRDSLAVINLRADGRGVPGERQYLCACPCQIITRSAGSLKIEPGDLDRSAQIRLSNCCRGKSTDIVVTWSSSTNPTGAGIEISVASSVFPDLLGIVWRRRRRGVLSRRELRYADDQNSGQNEYGRRACDHFDVACCDCAACAWL